MSEFFVRMRQVDVFNECRRSHLAFWECPPFLFIVMGLINIFTVVATYAFASRIVDEPEIAALIVLLVSVLIFAVGTFLISGFNKIAEANRIKGEFLNVVSHQLRAPLSVFRWTLELLEGECEKHKVCSSHLPALFEHSERMVRIVNMLLDVSRIEARRFSVARMPVEIGALTEDAVRSLRPYAETTGITVHFEKKTAGNVLGDAERLRMVVQNLLDNAIRHSAVPGRVDIVLDEAEKGFALWSIRDYGVGIPADRKKYIFKKFFRIANDAQNQTAGTGLGLYIAHAIVKEIGGEIGFESQEGKGSTFWFKIPMYKAVKN